MRMQQFNSFVRRLLLLAGVWWLLVGRDGSSWLLGGPVIVTLAAWRLDDVVDEQVRLRFRLRLWHLVRFVPFFVWRSLLGSCDVAWRAMHRRLPIAPVVYSYTLRLPAGSPARVFFASCINLLPGTLTASWEDDVLRVHVLTDGPRVMSELRTLECQVALLFGHPWTDDREGTIA